MAKTRLTSTNIKEYANRFIYMLRSEDGPLAKDEAAEQLNLTAGQMSALVKYMRRCSLADMERYIRYYPISSKKGYTLPKAWEDFLPCFSTLYQWAGSILKTIEPMREKMEKEGINIAEYLKNAGADDLEDTDNYLEGMRIDKDTSWFYENKED